MDSLTMQNLNRATMEYLMQNLSAGMSLVEVRSLCERFMLENGADSFWYYDVGAFVFSGEETTISISGKDYTTADRRIHENDLLTVDLSPQCQRIWGDYARTLVIEAGKVVVHPEEIRHPEWKRGLRMEDHLHHVLTETATEAMTFEELYFVMNEEITKQGFVNLDYLGNLGHSIVQDKQDRIYIEKGNGTKLSDVKMFTFEPHICLPGSLYGFKQEDIYYFEKGKLKRL